MNDLDTLAWPLASLDDAIAVLGRHASLPISDAVAVIPESFKDENEKSLTLEDIDNWLEWACNEFGIEVEALEGPISELEGILRRLGPALIRYTHNGRFHVLLLLRVSSDNAILVAPDRQLVNYPLAALLSSLTGPLEEEARIEVEQMVVDIPAKNRSKASRYLLEQSNSTVIINGLWMLRTPPAGSVWPQVLGERLHSKLITVLVVSTVLYGLGLVAWALMGKGALAGHLGVGWLLAWALLTLTIVVLGLFIQWVEGMFSIGIGTVLKTRLLAGSLRISSDALRSQGVGQQLGRVIESQSFDSLLLGGGLGLLTALLELAISAWVLSIGAGGLLHVVLLLLWIFVTFICFLIFFKKHRRWTKMRLDLTHDLVEKMVGHRTRLVQEQSADRHLQEDQQVERYLEESRQFDRSSMPLIAGIGRGWLVVGLLGIAPVFVADSGTSVGLAISVGGVMLAYGAFASIVNVGAIVVQAAVAWEHIGELLKASAEPLDSGMPILQSSPQAGNVEKAECGCHDASCGCDAVQAQVLIQARDLSYRYPNQKKSLLSECNFTIYQGEKILLEGPSGGGKSTLAALLTGLRQQDSGLLLLNGLDRSSWGSSWRRQSTSAPQFHENHIVTGTLAFNLLMGRTWPASAKDMADAHILCLQLGLGDLLQRMPSGILQMVGESGWQLSHGERSRVYLARALLQNADLVVLDESFAALDPETLTQCLKTSLSRASSLLVIAHP